MKTNFKLIGRVFEAAEKEGRENLLEHEVYAVLESAGLTAPRRLLAAKGKRIGAAALAPLGPASYVLKIVSPLIQHKTDAGGVRFVKGGTAAVNRAVDEMIAEVPAKFVAWSKKHDGAGTPVPSRAAVEKSIRGVLVSARVDFEDIGYGSEMIFGIRNTRDFGPVVTAGAGGLDVEYMNERIRTGRSVALSSAHLQDASRIPALLEPLAFYGKVARPFRGRRPLIAPLSLAAAYARFAGLATAFSPFAEESPYVIEEMEVNPFVVNEGKLVALDGLCRFSRKHRTLSGRPAGGIGSILHPGSIGIIGVSDKMNIGHIILNNIIQNGFPRENIYVVKPGVSEIEGCRCVPAVSDLPVTVDMFVLTLGADRSYEVMKELTEYEKARSVIFIAGGVGEKQGTGDLEAGIKKLIAEGRAAGKITPVVNGGNCVGIASKPGRYDTIFIPEYKLPRPRASRTETAAISQSGAFMLSRMSKMPHIGLVYAVSLGNQIDLTVSDYLGVLKDSPDVRTFAVYMEGFVPGDGLAFARAVKDISAAGKTAIVYKSGRSPEGRSAASSHTASVAGEYDVCRAILAEAGALVCDGLLEFEKTVAAAALLGDKPVRGNRVAMVTNAGFECVVMADSLKGEDGSLVLADLTPETRARILGALTPLGIDRLLDVRNPVDVTPVARDDTFFACTQAVIEDANVDCAVISPLPMTTAMQTIPPREGGTEGITHPDSFAQKIIPYFLTASKPFVVVIDAGKTYDPFRELLEQAGIPVFRRCDEAIRFMRRYVGHRLRFGDARRSRQ
ncbi:MAG: acetate--CoA ligase family protein [Candidatus Aminicenantales bacterium]